MAPPPPGSLTEIALVFLKLGLIGFGGPAAHIALMRRELVERRRWLDDESFLEHLAAANLVPGPTSTELAIHLGHQRGGWRGLLVAGACFILPAALIVYGFAVGYRRYGALPELQGALYAVKPVVIAVVAQAIWGLGRSALRTPWLAAVAAAAFAAAALGAGELVVLLGAGVACALAARGSAESARGAVAAPLGLLLVQAPAAAPSVATAAALPVFGVFLKIGSVLFGSGYVLLAFLQSELVERLGWLTQRELLDAVAVGQVTPGPVFTTATFIGYLVGGAGGAAAATLGIFLPAFLFVAVSGWILPRVRRSPTARAALDGVAAASLALMALVTLQLARAALVDLLAVALALVGALLLLRWKVSPAWLICGALLVGVLR